MFTVMYWIHNSYKFYILLPDTYNHPYKLEDDVFVDNVASCCIHKLYSSSKRAKLLKPKDFSIKLFLLNYSDLIIYSGVSKELIYV